MNVDKTGRYRTREGGVAWVLKISDSQHYYPVSGYRLDGKDDLELLSWMGDGQLVAGAANRLDLVEYIGPTEEGQPEEVQPCNCKALRKEIALYRDFVDEVASLIKQDIFDIVPGIWRAIGWLLFHLKLHRESERVKGERK